MWSLAIKWLALTKVSSGANKLETALILPSLNKLTWQASGRGRGRQQAVAQTEAEQRERQSEESTTARSHFTAEAGNGLEAQ